MPYVKPTRLRDNPVHTPSPASYCPDGTGHHWILPIPNGPLAHSHCKKCASGRAFKNAMDDVLSHNDDGIVMSSLGRIRFS